uniref:CENPB protein Homeodomainlike putative n=1 Tax=Albugo laibachii Nc14 TaxID=890382 RepID=F0WX38_9STRA|nr:CENPB protein Homeodomainlike putative [Albugo laibachii Nc14]CCA27616.1 DNA binding protein putative [Albugo laibachii Nc14]|eukprot:CCA27616.1 DNA binding protein putative [Albugo laibachii Nc14]
MDAWVEVTPKLAVTPSRKIIYRVLQTRSNVTVRNPECKTKRTVSSSEPEERLLLWIFQCEDYKLPIITGVTIQAKAANIRCDLARSGNSKDTVKLKALVFYHRWLLKFQKRHDLTSKRLHRVVASMNLNAVESERIALEELTLSYEKRDVFNTDKTAFFCCSMPVKSITKDGIAGRRHEKNRLTVASCCNADGTTKLPLLFVGFVKNRAAFKETPLNSLDCNTNAQKKD